MYYYVLRRVTCSVVVRRTREISRTNGGDVDLREASARSARAFSDFKENGRRTDTTGVCGLTYRLNDATLRNARHQRCLATLRFPSAAIIECASNHYP